MRRAFKFVQDLLEEILPAIALAAVTLMVSVAVLSRYLLHRPFAPMNEITVLVVVWSVWLGGAAATNRRLHVGIDLILGRLRGRSLAVADLLVTLFSLATVAILAWLGYDFAATTSLQLQVVGISKGWLWLALPVGSTLIGVRLLQRLPNAVRGIRTKRYMTEVKGFELLSDREANALAKAQADNVGFDGVAPPDSTRPPAPGGEI